MARNTSSARWYAAAGVRVAVQPGFDAAWTDAVLATASLGGAWACRDRVRWMAPVGLAVIGVAASVGTFRLGGVQALTALHVALSIVAGAVGVPLAGLGLATEALPDARLRGVWVGCAVVGVALAAVHALAPASAAELARTAVAAVCLVGAIVTSARRRRWTGVLGPIALLVTGLVVAGDGTWAGFARDGWFHLGMALSTGLIAAASRRSDGPRA